MAKYWIVATDDNDNTFCGSDANIPTNYISRNKHLLIGWSLLDRNEKYKKVWIQTDYNFRKNNGFKIGNAIYLDSKD